MSESRVVINNISAERFWDEGRAIPGKVQVSTNLNITGLNQDESGVSIPFVANIGYEPSVAQITFRGKVLVKGNQNELDEIVRKYEEKENPPSYLVQNIINKGLVEATVVSRTLNIPPPIPLPKVQSQEDLDNSDSLNYVG